MKNIIKAFVYSSIILFLSCNGKVNKGDAKSFYFPYQNFNKYTSYKFVNMTDSTDFYVWQMHLEVSGKDTFLTTTIFNNKEELNEKLKEKINGNGSTMFNYGVYEKDSTNAYTFYETKINADLIYKWKFNSNDSIKWNVNHTMNENKIDFTKTRICTGDTVTALLFGRSVPCMEFYDRFDVKVTPTKGETKNYSYFIQSYYAQGVGLVLYKLSLPGTNRQDYTLAKITTR